MVVFDEEEFVDMVLEFLSDFRWEFGDNLELGRCFDYIIYRIEQVAGESEVRVDLGGELYDLFDEEVEQLIIDLLEG